MPRRLNINSVPKTPSGKHFQIGNIDADEIEVDSEISIKPELLRQCVPGNPWFEEGDPEHEDEPKFVARKSIDLRKMRLNKDKIEAIISSPMVDSRPRRVSYSKSFTEGLTDKFNLETPLRLPKQNDLVSSTSRRLSRIILTRHRTLIAEPGRNSLLFPINPNEIACNDNLDFISGTLFEKENLEPNDDKIQTQAQSSTQVFNLEDNDPSTISDLLVLANLEVARVESLCSDWSGVLSEESENIPEIALDSIRATIGKCKLLLLDKIPYFMTLVKTAEQGLSNCEASSDAFVPKVGINDLMGYWSLVAVEIKQEDNAFERLRLWRDEHQWEVEKRPQTPARSFIPVRKQRSKQSVKRLLSKKTKTLFAKVSDSEVNSLIPIRIDDAVKELKPILNNNRSSTKSKFAKFLEARKKTESSTSHTNLNSENRAQLRKSKRISFAASLSQTPGGHSYGSGSPRESFPLTPANTSGSLVSINRVRRHDKSLAKNLTPLGLRHVSKI